MAGVDLRAAAGCLILAGALLPLFASAQNVERAFKNYSAVTSGSKKLTALTTEEQREVLWVPQQQRLPVIIIRVRL